MRQLTRLAEGEEEAEGQGEGKEEEGNPSIADAAQLN